MKPVDPLLRWSMRYYEHETLPILDPSEYKSMSSGIIDEDRLDQPARAHIIFGFGPFQLKVGDTLKVEMAELFGFGLKGLMKNSGYVDFCDRAFFAGGDFKKLGSSDISVGIQLTSS